ncbi:hypothetical protein KC19_VG313600 [Ceratodon purpureus]|uniref:Uncharacterized protein n=1 Tax=Ceratodon purpureus TaxID=3225 RepID=A0A8T0HWI0_CERPU|nr:hypothetical protein KC19_VG313600 [Ceratodon purpureus]
MVRIKHVEITAYVIRATLGFEEGKDLAGRKPVHSYQRRYSRYGLTAADHRHDGNRVSALHPDYQVRVQALGDAIGCKQRLIFVSNNLLEHIIAVEAARA